MPRTVSYPAVANVAAGVLIARSRHARAYLRELGRPNGVVIACDLTPAGWVPVRAMHGNGAPTPLPPCFTLRPDWRDALNRAHPVNEWEDA